MPVPVILSPRLPAVPESQGAELDGNGVTGPERIVSAVVNIFADAVSQVRKRQTGPAEEAGTGRGVGRGVGEGIRQEVESADTATAGRRRTLKIVKPLQASRRDGATGAREMSQDADSLRRQPDQGRGRDYELTGKN